MTKIPDADFNTLSYEGRVAYRSMTGDLEFAKKRVTQLETDLATAAREKTSLETKLTNFDKRDLERLAKIGELELELSACRGRAAGLEDLLQRYRNRRRAAIVNISSWRMDLCR